MRVDHVQVTLVYRDIDRLANGAARQVHGRRGISEFDEIVKIFQRGITSAFIQVEYEGTTIGGYENRVFTSYLDVTIGIAGVLGILGGCRCLDNGTTQATRESYPFTVNLGAPFLQNIQCHGHIAEVDSNLFKNGIGIIFDEFEALFIEYFKIGNFARDIRFTDADNLDSGTMCARTSATATSAIWPV